MTAFEMIKYHSREYPADIPLRIEEIAAHFDVQSVAGPLDWSLHTEYSYGKRCFGSGIVSSYTNLHTITHLAHDYPISHTITPSRTRLPHFVHDCKEEKESSRT